MRFHDIFSILTSAKCNPRIHTQRWFRILRQNSTMYFGCRQDLDMFFDGSMDEVGIWNVELTSEEMIALYNSGTPISNSH